MAADQHQPQKVAAILEDYSETLEVLTINSKPLINDLTMAADRYKPLAPQIIEKIESRLFEVSTAFTLVFIDLCVSLYVYLLLFLYNFTDSWETAVNKGTISKRVSVQGFFLQRITSTSHPAFLSCHEEKHENLQKRGVVKGLVTGSLPLWLL